MTIKHDHTHTHRVPHLDAVGRYQWLEHEHEHGHTSSREAIYNGTQPGSRAPSHRMHYHSPADKRSLRRR